MLEVAFWLAVACAGAGAFTGNRSAWLLLASAGACLALDAMQVEFHFVGWLLIDLAVILGIMRPHMSNADVMILALFIPAWAFYLLADPLRFTGSLVVVCAQLVLTFPLSDVGDRLRRVARWLKGSDDVLLLSRA